MSKATAVAPENNERAGLDEQDWEAFREIGHAMLDDMVTYLRDIRSRPAWQSPSPEARDAIARPLPMHGRGLSEVYDDFKNNILPYPTGNIHPRFWGWVMGNGTPVGMLAELLGGAMNCHVSGYDQAATLVERQVIAWLAQLMGYPLDASGLLVSGGTAANLIGLTTARNSAFDGIRSHGAQARGGQSPAVYASDRTHGWLGRSCDLLGIGESSFRRVPSDQRHRVDIEQMRSMIHEDRKAGAAPFCIVGNAGTITCGAVDDLNALADLAADEGVWFHVDGAFGALARFSPAHRGAVDGIERADSIAFDLHKWGYMQYESGVVLVRDRGAHDEAFSFAPSYLETLRGGIAVEPTEFASKGVQLSRGFRALKVWMQLSTYGVHRIGAVISQNIQDVGYLREIIDACPEIERLGPSELNVVCFRYNPGGLDTKQLDEINRELLVQLHESGVAVPSNARVDDSFALRVANTNHRSKREDFDLLIETVLRLGGGLAHEQCD